MKIIISDELKEVLNKIKDDSHVAKLLLQESHSMDYLVDSPVNFISVGIDDKTKISYITNDRIPSVDPREIWTSSRRYQTKPGALVSKIFKGVPGIEIEKFSNLFISQSNKVDFRFEVIKGDAIKHYYYYENYSSSNGSLGASCMKHEHCQNYFQLYTENDENVSMLVMFRPGDSRCIGRALLWDFESNKIMDRIYTINDELLSYYFKQWATENGYFYKSEQNWYNTLYFEQIGQSKKELRMEIKLKNAMPSRFPYMDTFKFMCMENGVLYNYLPENKRNLRTLCGSEGSTQPSDYLVFDVISNVMRYRHDAAFIGYLPTPIYTGRDNANYSNYNDKWMLKEHSVYNEIIGDYIFNDEYAMHNNPEIVEIIKRRMEEKEAYEAKLKKLGKKSSDTNSLMDELRSVTSSMYMDWDNSSRGWGALPTISSGRYRSANGRAYGRVDEPGQEQSDEITEAPIEATRGETRSVSQRIVIDSVGSTLRDMAEQVDSIQNDVDELNSFLHELEAPHMIGNETHRDMRVPIARRRPSRMSPSRAPPIDDGEQGTVLDSQSSTEFENIRPDGGIPSGGISSFYNTLWNSSSVGRPSYYTRATNRATTGETDPIETPRTNGYEEFDIEDDDMPF